MLRRLTLYALALLATPAAAQTERPIKHGEVFDLSNGDRIVSPVPLSVQDENGIAVAKHYEDKRGAWSFSYPNRKALLVKGTAALQMVDKGDGRFVYALPRFGATLADAVAAPRSPFRNGVAMSNSLNGYVEDPVRFTGPYIFTAGVRSIRMPVRRKNLFNGTALTPVIQLNGYATKQLKPIFSNIELALANDVMFVIDDHTYSKYGEPDVLKFWVAFGTALKARFGDNDLIVLELQNESGKAAWDAEYAQSVKALVAGIREAGITYPLAVGWGGWNDVAHFNRAMSDLDKIGGPRSIDPLNKIIWTGHHYPTTTGNDQAKPGRSKPEIAGSAVSATVPAFFDGCKARLLKCMVTEIGMGGGARGWLANGSGNPKFDGKAWFQQYSEIQSRYAGTVVGTITWGGGSAWKDDYAFKVEYGKDAWGQTPATDFFATMKPFWAR